VQALDNPVWHALTGSQRGHAEGGVGAVRMRPEVGPWAAVPDHPSAECWAELGALLGQDGGAVLIRPDPIALPDGWATMYAGTAVQMTAAPGLIRAAAPPTPDRPVEVLGPQDVPQMLELVKATQPGPFAERTITLGTYRGIRHDGRLVAMAGERLRPPGHVEISAVCTDVEHRGRGFQVRRELSVLGVRPSA
jgi:hypothetical protein